MLIFPSLFLAQGQLTDGCKLVVFSATFAAKENAKSPGGADAMCMRLLCNGVRLAHRSARLGFLPPSTLTRGISLKSVVPGK